MPRSLNHERGPKNLVQKALDTQADVFQNIGGVNMFSWSLVGFKGGLFLVVLEV